MKDRFELVSKYQPQGDQPQAIEKLVKGIQEGRKHQTLLGATGTGKTFTVSNLIKEVNKPTLVIAHNKPLPDSCTASLRSFSRTTLSSILSAITITISRRRTCLKRILL